MTISSKAKVKVPGLLVTSLNFPRCDRFPVFPRNAVALAALFFFPFSFSSLVAAFQGGWRSRQVWNWMTACHLQISVEVTSAPGVPQPAPSAFMIRQKIWFLSTRSLPETLPVNAPAHRTTLYHHIIQIYNPTHIYLSYLWVSEL